MPLGFRLLFFLLACGAARADILEGRVMRVSDGDSLSVCIERQEIRIRLLYIDAPEYRQPFGLEARQSLVDLCDNKVARVQWTSKDRYGRTLGEVSCDGVDVNAEQVRRGLAWVSRLDQPDASFFSAERAARARRLGLWSETDAIPPWKWRRANSTPSVRKGPRARAC